MDKYRQRLGALLDPIVLPLIKIRIVHSHASNKIIKGKCQLHPSRGIHSLSSA